MTARGHVRLRREGKMRWINPVSDDASDKEQAGARPTPRPRALPQNTKTSHPQPTGRPRPPFPAAPDRPQPTGAARLPRDGVAVGKRNLSLVRHVALYATAENLRSIVRAGISYGDEKLTLHAHMAQPTLPIYMGKRVRVA